MSSVVIIGGGPAGLSAAIYAARASLDVSVLFRDGGALQKTGAIENYFGFPEPLSGPELLERGQAQAKRLGALLVECEVTGIEFASKGYNVKTTKQVFSAEALIIAAGSPRHTPVLEGISDFEGRGVSYCAVCDAFFYRGKPVAVLGNGEYAIEEARTLLPAASKVTLLTNGKSPPEHLPQSLNIDLRRVKAIEGDDRVRQVSFETGGPLTTEGVFIALGTAGSSDLAFKLGVFTENGCIKTQEDMSTNVPGVFAAGDCVGGLLQISKAVSDGASAALSAVKYLRNSK